MPSPKIKTEGKAILVDKKVVPVDDLFEWDKWFEAKNNRIVEQTHKDDVIVSTVFLAMDHGWDGNPKWFETMIFDKNREDEYQTRCETWDEALEMHKKALEVAFGDVQKD